MHLSRIAGYTLLFMLARNIARQCKTNIWVPAVPLMMIGGLEAGWGLAQYAGGETGIAGTSGDRDLFAGLLEMFLPFTLFCGIAILYRGRERGAFAAAGAIKASALWLIAAGILAAIVFSFSKMGFIAAIGSLFVVGVLVIGRKVVGGKRWLALAGLVALLAVTFVFLPPNELIEQFGGLASDPTAEGRLPIWKDTLHLIAAYPVFGCGLGNFNPGLLRYETAGLSVGWAWAHNDYLQLLAELGVVGFLIPATLMIAVLVLAARAALRGSTRDVRLLGLACSGAIAAILIHSIAQFNMYTPANAMVLSWISGIATALPGSVERPSAERFILTPTFIRNFTVALGVLASLYAGAWLVFLRVFPNHPNAERAFCRFGICDTDGAMASLQQAAGTTGIAAIPRAELIGFLRRDPAGPARWCDLGASFQISSQVDSARYCFSRALVLGPHLPYILFRTAMFHLSLGENQQALHQMAEALEGDPGYDQTVFDNYEQERIPADEILRYGLADRRTHQAYLHFLIVNKKADAGKVWSATLTRSYADDKLADEYIGFLLQNEKPEAAREAWALYTRTRDPSYPEPNHVFNGDFELDPTHSPFDWTLDPGAGVKIDFDRQTVHSGARSLRLQFDGTLNLTSLAVHQTVFLKPGRYRFQAWVRTQDLSTDEGVAFRVSDEYAPNRLSFTTEPVLGTTGWKLVQHVFQVPPGTKLVEIRLVRTASLRFDNLLKGTLWVDQVSIQPD